MVRFCSRKYKGILWPNCQRIRTANFGFYFSRYFVMVLGAKFTLDLSRYAKKLTTLAIYWRLQCFRRFLILIINELASDNHNYLFQSADGLSKLWHTRNECRSCRRVVILSSFLDEFADSNNTRHDEWWQFNVSSLDKSQTSHSCRVHRNTELD